MLELWVLEYGKGGIIISFCIMGGLIAAWIIKELYARRE